MQPARIEETQAVEPRHGSRRAAAGGADVRQAVLRLTGASASIWRWQNGLFVHFSSASIASWFGFAATRMRRHGRGLNATAARSLIDTASTSRTASTNSAA